MRTWSGAWLGVLLLASNVAHADVPAFITYSGRLTEGTAWGQSTTLQLTFAVYAQAEGGAALWTSDPTEVAVADAYFSVILGEGTDAGGARVAVTEVFAANPATWLGVSVGTEVELAPRQAIGSVPYAARALSSARLEGGTLAAMKSLLGLDGVGDERFALNLRNAITKDCPPDYERIEESSIPATGYYCRKSVGSARYDEMVKVGDFWIDRHPMSLWENRSCDGQQFRYQNQAHDYGFTRNGTDSSKQLYGCSVANVYASNHMTWFQAQQACVNAGKDLCTNEDWQAAAAGTPDPGPWPDTNEADGCGGSAPLTGACNTCAATERKTGRAWTGDFLTSCMSRFGAYDMIGNHHEWTKAWSLYGDPSGDANGKQVVPEYKGDGHVMVVPAAYNGVYSDNQPVFPAVARRAGAYHEGSSAGVFFFNVYYGAALADGNSGARCCRRL